MRIFAISDLHLSLGTPEKNMEIFGDHWIDHAATIERNWRRVVHDDDLVLVAGDISWAMRLDGARADLEYLGQLPGTKVLIRGNHDYWWNSISRIRENLPVGAYALQNDAVRVGSAIICGTRLWDTPGISFDSVIDVSVALRAGPESGSRERDQDNQRLYGREIGRLGLALQAMENLATDEAGELRIVMTHYPPCDAHMAATQATELFVKHGIRHAVFGHLHNVWPDIERPFGQREGIHYHLVACDYIGFTPVLIDIVGE